MAGLSYEIFNLRRRTPLRISRGVTGGGASTTCVWVRVESDGVQGWGEAGPFSTGGYAESQDDITHTLDIAAAFVAERSVYERKSLIDAIIAGSKKVSSAALAAIDTAMLDWLGRQVGLPLWRLWGLDVSTIPPTSVTVGISEPDDARKRVREWLQGDMRAGVLCPRTGGAFRMLKVKLGSPEGIGADREMLEAVLDEAGDAAEVIVDANAGWSLEDAVGMCRYLSSKGIKLVEQPLAVDAFDSWRRLHDESELKIFADESCLSARDVCRWADVADGVVVKMMKCGGLSESFAMIHTARACGMDVMLGCYSDTALSNSAMAQLAPMADYVDLDSHFNLLNDPFRGAELHDGRLLPNQQPGIGVTYCETSA